MWKDSYLTWDPAEYGGIKDLALHPSAIWVPDGYFENKLVPLYITNFSVLFDNIQNRNQIVAWIRCIVLI